MVSDNRSELKPCPHAMADGHKAIAGRAKNGSPDAALRAPSSQAESPSCPTQRRCSRGRRDRCFLAGDHAGAVSDHEAGARASLP